MELHLTGLSEPSIFFGYMEHPDEWFLFWFTINMNFRFHLSFRVYILTQTTPPKTNMEPNSWWFVDVSPFPRVYVQSSMLVFEGVSLEFLCRRNQNTKIPVGALTDANNPFLSAAWKQRANGLNAGPHLGNSGYPEKNTLSRYHSIMNVVISHLYEYKSSNYMVLGMDLFRERVY